MRPPRSEMMPIVSTRAAAANVTLRKLFDRHATGFEHPAFFEAIGRHQRILRIAYRHDITRPFRNQVIRQMTLESTRMTALRPRKIESKVVRRFDPRHHARDIVEVHVTARTQTVKNLLQPRGAA